MPLGVTTIAQLNIVKDTTAPNKHDTANQPKQVDITDVLKKWLKIKSMGTASPVANEEKKRYFALFPAIGYTLQTRLAVIVAGNEAFYTDKRDSLEKLSTVTASVAFTENSQIVLPIESDIWTKNNKYNLVGDWRISKYPQDTYGLGGTNDLDTSEDLINYSYIRFYQTALRKITSNLYAGVGYNLDYHWGISEDGYADRESDFAKYPGNHSKTVSSGISLNLLYDGRDNPINPSGGEYANVVLRNNFTFLGSDQNWESLLVDLRKYFPFPARSGNVLAFWNYDWLVLSGTPPYLDLPSTSWDTYTNTGRGYIQGRFRSRQMLYFEGEYRFHITGNGLLGGVVFANVQSFSQYPGNYSFQYLQPAAGLGLRVKLNKSSKTNIDIDYGWGMGESHGLFVNIGEVF